jgi:hypothetical protein
LLGNKWKLISRYLSNSSGEIIKIIYFYSIRNNALLLLSLERMDIGATYVINY